MTRKHGRTYGIHGATVRLWVDRGRVWCEWRDARKKRHTRSWSVAQEADAKRWAEEYSAERRRLMPVGGPIPTVAELWTKYKAANQEGWRPKTAKLYAEWAGRLESLTRPVSELGHEDADALRDRLRAKKIAHGTIRRLIGFLRQLLNFAQGRRIIGQNPLATYRYKTPRNQRSERPAEYQRDELLKIAAALDWPEQWRARNAIQLCASYGARINAILHLRWDDVDFEQGMVTFRSEWDKTGEAFTRPMTAVARAALLESRAHRNASGWVFWSRFRPTKVLRYSGLHWHLLEAEKRAGVTHINGRAFHGLRRMVVGDIGDLSTAAQWLKQSTLAVTNQYMRDRPENLERARLTLEQREAGA